MKDAVPLDLFVVSPGFVALMVIVMAGVFYLMYKFVRKHGRLPFQAPPTNPDFGPRPVTPDPWADAERRLREREAEIARREQALKDRENRPQ